MPWGNDPVLTRGQNWDYQPSAEVRDGGVRWRTGSRPALICGIDFGGEDVHTEAFREQHGGRRTAIRVGSEHAFYSGFRSTRRQLAERTFWGQVLVYAVDQ